MHLKMLFPMQYACVDQFGNCYLRGNFSQYLWHYQTQLGLTDATNPFDFSSKLTVLEECWNSFEVSGK